MAYKNYEININCQYKLCEAYLTFKLIIFRAFLFHFYENKRFKCSIKLNVKFP